MSRFVYPLIVFLACLSVVFLGIGKQGVQRQEQLKAGLDGQMTIALHLKALREAAQVDNKDALVTVLNDSLAQLAPAANDFSVAPPAEPLPQQLDISTNALINFGVETDSAEDRAKALTAVTRIWGVARNEGITDSEYPAALIKKMGEVENYICSASEGKTPESSPAVAQMQATLYQLNYVSELYTSRAGNGYAPVENRARKIALDTAALRDTVTPLLACEQRLEPIQPTYPAVAPDQAENQLNDLTAALANSSLAVLADPAVGTDENRVEVTALTLALHPLA